MRHSLKTLLPLALIPFPALALDIHVAPDRETSTLTAARDALRASGKLGKEPCQVLIHSGTYRLDQPLELTPDDSGSKEHPAIWKAAGDGKVVITGAELLSPTWEETENGIFRTRVPGQTAIDQLFANGKRQILARYPDLGAGFLPVGKDNSVRGKQAGNVPYDGSTPNAWDASKANDWADPTGAFLHGMHPGLWGSQHYRVLGKKPDGSLDYEGGWQNNRSSSPHKGYRMTENVFEELDSPGEWFHDTKSGWLYYQPADGIDLKTATFEAVRQIKHLINFHGETETSEMTLTRTGNSLGEMTVETHHTTTPVRHIRIEGLTFTGTARTFMETREPLLRSDWSIYRGGALHLRGTEHITIARCRFEELGGNAVFVDSYNKHTGILSNRFRDNGASDVNLVGSFAAVRDPAFGYRSPAPPLDEIDTTPGPKSDDYPADCRIADNLMTRCGRFEKQVAGVNLSMSSRVTISHNTISHTPRAAINICDGTWGGHLIEGNDCFETVLETHDHGAFNSWGRDRIWHSANPSGPNQRDKSGKPLISHYIEKFPDSPKWDPYQTTVIRHNRMHCDHGWDIDLDDGSSNYEITNNLCLAGGLKTREGYHRIVRNNIILDNYTCNVPYPKPTHDVFESNIIWSETVYRSTNPALWGGSRNRTFVHNPDATRTEPATALQQETSDDKDSLYGNARFIDPANGNFQVADDSPALRTGFTNFPMTGFGVTSPDLQAEATAPIIRLPEKAATNTYRTAKSNKFLGARIKNLTNDAEVTATGVHEKRGTYLVDVPAGSKLAAYGFKSGDVVLKVGNRPTSTARSFRTALTKLNPGKYNANVWRDQQSIPLTIHIK